MGRLQSNPFDVWLKLDKNVQGLLARQSSEKRKVQFQSSCLYRHFSLAGHEGNSVNYILRFQIVPTLYDKFHNILRTFGTDSRASFPGRKNVLLLGVFFFLKTFMNNGNAKHAVVFFDTMKQGYYGSRRQVYANDIKSIVT